MVQVASGYRLMIFFSLIFNLTLLVALSIVSGFIKNRWSRHTRLGALSQGLLFGGAAVLGMLRPLNLGPGIIFDGRSIMVSLCALFFGPWAAAAAAGITIACRIGLGGAGTLTGSLVILSSAGIGLLARSCFQAEIKPLSVRNLYLFGLAVHLAMLALMFTLPGGAGLTTVTRIALPVMLLYPLATILSGKILSDQVEVERVMEALRKSEDKMHGIVENIGVGVALISPQMEILEMNHRMHEWFPDVDPGRRPICYRAFNQPPREAACDYCPTRITLQDGLVHEATTQTPQGTIVRNYRVISSPILDAKGEVTAAIEMVDDITERLSLEVQLRQSQKMEAIGRLAGGVAHDFNNMLGVIIGHAELAQNQLDPNQPLSANLQEIRRAAERSADLTRQLLAFARKQTVAPRVLDLNKTVEGVLKMLRRLIGEEIDLAWLPGAEVWPVKVDPSQIDQILANLCLNARDAIDGVGKVIIETRTVTLDEPYCAEHPGASPGKYVLLAVSDNGCGMDREILGKIFEPFFTTKEPGKGTGLGLSTVYGIVQQNNGFINVESEQGHGTTFNIYLPRHAAKNERMQEENPVVPVARGHETILLVEDEPSILKMTKTMLERQGYSVIPASTPGEAIRVAREHSGEIRLLMTDVVMPEMNGRDLAKNLMSLYPNLRRLFISGYTADVIAHHGVLDEGVYFLQKPFSMADLAAKVRKALDGESI